MLFITPQAAEQITKAAATSQIQEDLALRVEARRREDLSIEYLIGFDKPNLQEDLKAAGDSQIEVVYNGKCKELLENATMDFGEIEGEMNFIFLNPNDPHYVPPKEA